MNRNTTIAIQGDQFWINSEPTYKGRAWKDQKVEGLLFNSRMVQGIFDDLNPETRGIWAYPDSGKWDPERNTQEFIEAMSDWRSHGLLCFTINMQGGSPQGYSKHQPWHNSAICEDGELRPAYLTRLERVLNRADELGMAVILGIFYFGQAHRLQGETAILRAVDNTVGWVFDRDYQNILIEINNECNVQYNHPILQPERVHELIEYVKRIERGNRRLLVSTSYGGGTIPGANVVKTADYLLLHGNGVGDPQAIEAMVKRTRQVEGYRPVPILFNEDDHYGFDQSDNNLVAAARAGASWGYFDYRFPGEGFDQGYQSVPVNWGISSHRKRGFFDKVAEITGGIQHEMTR